MEGFSPNEVYSRYSKYRYLSRNRSMAKVAPLLDSQHWSKGGLVGSFKLRRTELKSNSFGKNEIRKRIEARENYDLNKFSSYNFCGQSGSVLLTVAHYVWW